MMKIRSLIVEDEIMARKSLERMCSGEDDIELVASCEKAEEALKVFDNEEIDLLFLDIEMPGLSGLELLERLPYLPMVVFTTAKKEYAFEAFEYDVVDFLKKPVSISRFSRALEKVRQRKDQLQKVSSFSSAHEMYLKHEGRLVRVPYTSVLYFENVGDYVKVFTEQGNYVIHGALKSIDVRLSYPGFLKIHRSYIVNLAKILDIEENTLVIGKKVIPISRAHRPILMKTINIL